MEMVKLKMRTVYKTLLYFIVFLILVLASLGINYMFFDKVVDDLDIEVNGALSINYMSGKKIDVSDKEIIKFSITNSSDEIVYYNIAFSKVRGNGKYILKYENNTIFEGNLKSIDEHTTDYISISSNETIIYTLEIINESSENLTSILNIREQIKKTTTFKDIILSNVSPSVSPLTKIAEEVAVENEGLIMSNDDTGITYYFRGNVPNNYVLFGDLLWRIVRINGDDTVRIILDGNTDSLTNYYGDDTTDHKYTSSKLKNHLDNWFLLNLEDYKDYIANTKFCSDIKVDDSSNYNAYSRIMTNKIPTFNCLGESITTNIGTLSIDEVIFAGAAIINSNTSYYLYNENIEDVWYTMSGAKNDINEMNMFMISKNGEVKSDINGNLYRYARPVINLVKSIKVIGDGTKDNPYRLEE